MSFTFEFQKSESNYDKSIDGTSIKTSTKETLLGILIDSDSVLTNIFLPSVVKIARNYML